MTADTFRTLSTAIQAEPPRTKGSRFLADAIPVSSVDEASARLKEVRSREHSATHHVWAYRLGAGASEFRSSDDGEPNGSAGIPVLRAIESADLTNVLVVVTRYYGGTKLGTGGLARAYGEAAAEALAQARKVKRIVRERVLLKFAFDDTSAAMRLLDRFDASVADQRYSDQGTTLALDVRRSQVAELLAAFVEDTAGRGRSVSETAVGCADDISPTL